MQLEAVIANREVRLAFTRPFHSGVLRSFQGAHGRSPGDAEKGQFRRCTVSLQSPIEYVLAAAGYFVYARFQAGNPEHIENPVYARSSVSPVRGRLENHAGTNEPLWHP